MHPFFETKSLTDEEINQKISLLNQRMFYARQVVGDINMINGLQSFIDSLYDEKEERLSRQTFDYWNNQFPATIETDPDFQPTKVDDKPSPGTTISARPTFSNKFNSKGLAGIPLDITPVPTIAGTKQSEKDKTGKKDD